MGGPASATPALAVAVLEAVCVADAAAEEVVAVGEVRPEGVSVPSVNTVSMLRDLAMPPADPSGGGVGPRAPN